jgi:membrane protein required for colicin V production
MIGWLDIVLAVILLGTILVGLVRGLVKETVGIAAAVAGFFIAARWYVPVAARIDRYLASPTVSKFLGFILVFAGVILVGAVVSFILSKIMVGPLKFANHLLGGVFGLVEGMFLCGALVFALLVFPVNAKALSESRLAPYCYGVTKAMVGLIPQELKDRFKAAYQEIVKREGVDGKKI